MRRRTDSSGRTWISRCGDDDSVWDYYVRQGKKGSIVKGSVFRIWGAGWGYEFGNSRGDGFDTAAEAQDAAGKERRS